MRSRTFLRSGMGFGGCFTDLSLIDGDFHVVTQLPDGHLVEIPGARLLVHEEKPADVTRAVLEFLH